MEDTDLAFSPVWRLRELLDNRAVSSVELTEPFLRRIEAINPQLNAFLTVTAEEPWLQHGSPMRSSLRAKTICHLWEFPSQLRI